MLLKPLQCKCVLSLQILRKIWLCPEILNFMKQAKSPRGKCLDKLALVMWHNKIWPVPFPRGNLYKLQKVDAVEVWANHISLFCSVLGWHLQAWSMKYWFYRMEEAHL